MVKDNGSAGGEDRSALRDGEVGCGRPRVSLRFTLGYFRILPTGGFVAGNGGFHLRVEGQEDVSMIPGFAALHPGLFLCPPYGRICRAAAGIFPG